MTRDNNEITENSATPLEDVDYSKDSDDPFVQHLCHRLKTVKLPPKERKTLRDVLEGEKSGDEVDLSREAKSALNKILGGPLFELV